MARIWFSKYEALGNDFIILDLRIPQGGENFSPHDFAVKYCSRNFGIGADGVITVEKPSSEEFDFKMRVINRDGSEAEMSGNGIRCAAKYLVDMKLIKRKDMIVFETLSGKREVKISGENFEVDMGEPKITRTISIRQNLEGIRVDVGNPHVVIFGDLSREDFLSIAPEISKSENANVEFANMISHGIRVWVWERGVGETLACGTGAVAVFKAGREKKIIKNEETKIIFAGGELIVKGRGEGKICIEGGARYIFSGYVDL